jgi:hypothetical protein
MNHEIIMLGVFFFFFVFCEDKSDGRDPRLEEAPDGNSSGGPSALPG